MNIRKLAPEEHIRTKQLYREVFPEDSPAFADYYYTEKIKDNVIYVIEENGEIVSMLHLNPYDMVVNGTVRRLHYIVAVATRADHRHRGCMRALLKRALNELAAAREVFTYLMPVAENLYQPFDFRTVYHLQLKYHEPETVPAPGQIIEEIRPEEVCELADSANNWLYNGGYQVFTHRDPAYYRRLIKELASEAGRLMVYKRQGTIEDARMEVRERMSDDPKIMIRILDIRALLESMNAEAMMALCLTVTDELVPQNNGSLLITSNALGRVTVAECPARHTEGQVPIGALTGVLFGTMSVSELADQPGVEMNERMRGELEKIIPLSRIYINEVV